MCAPPCDVLICSYKDRTQMPCSEYEFIEKCKRSDAMIRCHDVIVPRTVMDASMQSDCRLTKVPYMCAWCSIKVGVVQEDIKGELGHWRGLQVHVAWSTVQF